MTEEEKNKVRRYKACFATEAGKQVLEDLSNYCFENRSTFVELSQSREHINQGKRAVILYIKFLLEHNPDKPEQTETIHEGVRL